jgi:hypothetical protein
MRALEIARKVYVRPRARGNGHVPNARATVSPCEESEESDESEVSPQPVRRHAPAPHCEESEGTQPAGADYFLMRDQRDLVMALTAVDESTRIGLDIETVGLDPRTGRMRLLSLATDRGTYLVDCFAVRSMGFSTATSATSCRTRT